MSSGSETDRLDFVPSAAILLNVLLIAYCSVLFIGLPRLEYFDIIIILSCLFTDNPFRNDYYLQKLIIWISQLGPPPQSVSGTRQVRVVIGCFGWGGHCKKLYLSK